VLAALVYAQAAFGGWLAAALGVAVEAANYGPDLLAKSAALAGIVLPRAPLPAPFASSSASPAPPANAPANAASDAPASEASDAPAAAPSDEPNETPNEEPTDAPNPPPVQHV
jgi:small subunit ribosomal protein S2